MLLFFTLESNFQFQHIACLFMCCLNSSVNSVFPQWYEVYDTHYFLYIQINFLFLTCCLSIYVLSNFLPPWQTSQAANRRWDPQGLMASSVQSCQHIFVEYFKVARHTSSSLLRFFSDVSLFPVPWPEPTGSRCWPPVWRSGSGDSRPAGFDSGILNQKKCRKCRLEGKTLVI